MYTCLGDSRASYLILEEAIKQIENAKRDRMNVEIPSDTVYSLLEILNTIEADVARNLVRAKAQLYISKHKDLAAKKVIGRDAFTFIDTHQSPLLVDPLAMQVIACKPIFYNLALAGVEYPTISVDNANEPVIDADEPGDAPISFLGSVLGGLWGTK